MALRASYLCSLCKTRTAGPSDEASDAVTVIGVAAHICAAAPGPGARRYDPAMTPEQRAHIDNGIWLCSSCSVLIDRDEARYTVEALHRIKQDHESAQKLGIGHSTTSDDIIAIGPDIVALGRIIRSAPAGTRVRLSHFVNGSPRELWSMARDFGTWPAERRYVLLNELGFGALLAEPPSIELVGHSYEVELKLHDSAQRQNATASIGVMCREKGRMLRGLDAHIQRFESILGLARGTWFTDLTLGSDLSDLFWRYQGSPWFERLAKAEMIRLSSIPRLDRIQKLLVTPFGIVKHVDDVNVPTFDLLNQHLNIAVTFNLEGIGMWSHTLSVFISTPEQLSSSQDNARKHNAVIISSQR